MMMNDDDDVMEVVVVVKNWRVSERERDTEEIMVHRRLHVISPDQITGYIRLNRGPFIH